MRVFARVVFTLGLVCGSMPLAAQTFSMPYDVSNPTPPGPPERVSGSHEPRVTQWEAMQLQQVQRWAAVGRCVVAQDRVNSLAYAKAPTAQGVDQRLAPAFDSCLAGAKIADTGNRRFRRAAVADALRTPSTPQ